MAKITAIVDQDGRIMAAQFDAPRAADDDEVTPSAQLIPMPGQRTVQMDIPDEVQRLSGPDMSRYFSQVEISWPATIDLPNIEIVRRSHGSAEA